MLRAQGDGLHNPVVDPVLLVWNLEPWLRYKRLDRYTYTFDQLTFDDLFAIDDHFFAIKDVPRNVAFIFNRALVELENQFTWLSNLEDEMRYRFNPYIILKRLLFFLPNFTVPLLGTIPRYFLQNFEEAYKEIPNVTTTFKRNECKQLAYDIITQAVRNRSFVQSEIEKLKFWRIEVGVDILPHSR